MADPPEGDTSAFAPLTVLWLIKGLGRGGAEMLLVNQARAARGSSVTYEVGYLVPWKTALVPDLEAAGVRVNNFACKREWDLRWAIRLGRRLWREPVDVVHAHSPYVAAIARLVVRALPRSRRPAMVYTEHNEWPRHKRASRWANRVTFGLDDAHFAVSDQVRASIPRSDSVEVLVHGIDLATTASVLTQRDEVRAELGVAPDEVVVGIVANFRKEKAYQDWIAAAAALPADRPVRFVSVGQGPLEEEMRDLVCDLGLDDRVTLLGSRDDAVRVMSSFDIFTLSSVHEGLPVSLMDALALGLPVAATTAGGIPQAVTDGVEGLLVPPARPDRLAGAIDRLAGDPALRESMGRAAGNRAGEYDVSRALARLEDVYRDAARRARGRP
jgi:glycosyltransferase involved in cell wall biosynthesis